MMKIEIAAICFVCSMVPVFADSTGSVTSPNEIVNKAAGMLAEGNWALANELILAHKGELTQHKNIIINTLGNVTDEDVRKAVKLTLSIILDTRDIPLVLDRAEKLQPAGEIDVSLVLSSLAQRSFYEDGPRSFDEWHLWWQKNRYRLDLDASECKNRALAAIDKYKEPISIQHLDDRLKNTEGEIRLDIHWAFCEIANFASGRQGPLSVVSPFVDFLFNQSEEVQQSAARILGLLRDPQAVEKLSECLLSDSTPSVKVECILALKSIGRPSVAALNHALDTFVPEDGPLAIQQEVLYNICGALEFIGEGESVSYLVCALENREFRNTVGGWATQAIKKIGLSGVGYLVEHIGVNEQPFDMSSWVPTLARTNFEIRDLVLSQVVDGWGWWDRSVSRASLNTRYKSNGNSIIACLNGYLDGQNMNKRLGAAICLAWLGHQDAGQFLVSSLITGDQTHPRIDIIEAVGFTGLDEAVPVLLGFLMGEDVHAATMSAQALGDIGKKSAVDGLLLAIDSKSIEDHNDRKLVQVALYALGKIGDRRAMSVLLQFAGPKKGMGEYVRPNPICALGYFSEEEALSTIVSGLSSHVREVRCASVIALETRGDSTSP